LVYSPNIFDKSTPVGTAASWDKDGETVRNWWSWWQQLQVSWLMCC